MSDAHISRIKGDPWGVFGSCHLYRKLRDEYPGIVPDWILYTIGQGSPDNGTLLMSGIEGDIYRVGNDVLVDLSAEWYETQIGTAEMRPENADSLWDLPPVIMPPGFGKWPEREI